MHKGPPIALWRLTAMQTAAASLINVHVAVDTLVYQAFWMCPQHVVSVLGLGSL